MPTEGTIYHKQYADLNGDGNLLTVALVAYNVEGDEYFGQLQVLDSNNNLIWEGPQAQTSGDAAFGVWHYGKSEISLIADIDGDGHVELISAEPVSDLRPPAFHVWRWNGEGFELLFSKCLIETGAGSGEFAWHNAPYEYSNDAWIGAISGENLLDISASVNDTNEEQVRFGKAQVMTSPNGFTVLNWTTPLS